MPTGRNLRSEVFDQQPPFEVVSSQLRVARLVLKPEGPFLAGHLRVGVGVLNKARGLVFLAHLYREIRGVDRIYPFDAARRDAYPRPVKGFFRPVDLAHGRTGRP